MRSLEIHMKDYFIHWWRGDLDAHYHFLWFTIGQVNKLARIGLYFIGLLALFDFIKWTNLMGGLRLASAVSVWVIRFAQGITSAPLLLWGSLIAVFRLATRQLNKREAFAYPFVYMLSAAQRDAQRGMKGHFIVRYLGWLEKQPISERVIKIFAFALFVVFALIELFTS